jgi:hypothetical protein
MYEVQVMNATGGFEGAGVYATKAAAEAAARTSGGRVVWGPEMLARLRRQMGIKD